MITGMHNLTQNTIVFCFNLRAVYYYLGVSDGMFETGNGQNPPSPYAIEQ